MANQFLRPVKLGARPPAGLFFSAGPGLGPGAGLVPGLAAGPVAGTGAPGSIMGGSGGGGAPGGPGGPLAPPGPPPPQQSTSFARQLAAAQMPAGAGGQHTPQQAAQRMHPAANLFTTVQVRNCINPATLPRAPRHPQTPLLHALVLNTAAAGPTCGRATATDACTRCALGSAGMSDGGTHSGSAPAAKKRKLMPRLSCIAAALQRQEAVGEANEAGGAGAADDADAGQGTVHPWLDHSPAPNRHPLDDVLYVRAPAAPVSGPVIFNDPLALNKSGSDAIVNHEGGVFGTAIKVPYTIFYFGGGHTYKAANFGVAFVTRVPDESGAPPAEEGAPRAMLFSLGVGTGVHDTKANALFGTLEHVPGVSSGGASDAAPSSRTYVSAIGQNKADARNLRH